MMRRLQNAIEQKLLSAQELGELGNSVNPMELAAFLVNTAQGMNVMAKANTGEETIQGIVRTTLAMLR